MDFSAHYDARAGEARNWWLSPAKRDAYVARFRGTFQEAVLEAAKSSAFWKTSIQIREDRSAAHVAPKDYMGPAWATVSVTPKSPLRG